ncbi:MAG: tetratricopeptide repeat protein [Pseudomonadales bacterium]|nr:tetratricopeptide repeat protein [Pseudomonadales bacterium]
MKIPYLSNGSGHRIRSVIIPWFCLLFLSFSISVTAANSEQKLSTEFNVESITTLQEIQALVASLYNQGKTTTTLKSADFILQETLVTTAGAAAGHAFQLFQSGNLTAGSSARTKATLLQNRELLLHLLKHNEKVIRHYQEHELDKMADPVRFFDSEQWQMPQKLISLSSYWLGWNGYYASLLMQPNEPLRATILNESIEAFSRSFIDFAEDEITTKSLYGRALVYKLQKTYGRSAYDFKSVKQRVDRTHPLYLNSLYQEALLSQLQGNSRVSRAIIKAIRSNYLSKDIPNPIRIGLKKLETQMIVKHGTTPLSTTPLIASNEQNKSNPASDPAPNKEPQENTVITSSDKKLENTVETKAQTLVQFSRLKKLARNDIELFDNFYQFAKKHSGHLAHLSYAELTPVAALAIANHHFNDKNFDAALKLYQPMLSENPAIINAQTDSIWLQTSYIYNHKKQWRKAIAMLSRFSEAFPNSHHLKASAELYYSAAISFHRQAKSALSSKTYMNATANYVAHCTQCSQIDDAYYTLARRQVQQGNHGKASTYFSKISAQSKHYFVALFHLAEVQLTALEALQQKVKQPTKHTARSTAERTRYQAATNTLIIYRANKNDKRTANLKPNWVILQARYALLEINPKYSAAVATLNQFNTRFNSANPTTESLHAQANALRATAYLRLANTKRFEANIDKLFNASIATGKPTLAAHNYKVLQRLANRFYSDTNTKTQANSYLGAIYAYQQLAEISRKLGQHSKHLSSIEFRIAKLYGKTGQLERSLQIYKQLVSVNPDSADALFALGYIHNDLLQWKESLDVWRQLSDGLKTGSPKWLEVRYQIANAMLRLERLDSACAIAKMTRVLHPKLQNSEFAAPFSQLEIASCKQKI